MRSTMPCSIVGDRSACLRCDRSLPDVGSDSARLSTQPREYGAGGRVTAFLCLPPLLEVPCPLPALGVRLAGKLHSLTALLE